MIRNHKMALENRITRLEKLVNKRYKYENYNDDGDAIAALISDGYDEDEAYDIVERGDIVKLDDMYSNMRNEDEAIGYYLVDSFGGVENLDKKTLHDYMDFEKLGHTLSIEYYQDDDEDPETAGEYWCGDADASDFEIGRCCVDSLGIEGLSNPEDFFDFKAYGRDASTTDHFIMYKGDIFHVLD